MTSGTPFPSRFSMVDELALPDHYYLSETDICFYLGEYTARGGFSYSDTNSLVLNFKKDMDRRGRPEWRHKGRAIREIAAAFSKALGEPLLRGMTYVPIPPSEPKGHSMHDDRLTQMLNRMSSSIDVDIRELVLQTASTPKSSRNEERLPPDEREQLYVLDESLAEPAPDCIAVVDDLLTTGSHFKAMQAVLGRKFPTARVIGLFVARRVPETDDPWDLDE